MAQWHAWTRSFGTEIAECELTHLAREPIDVARAQQQHRAYEELLRELGCELHAIEPLPAHPDAVFVEDAAVLLASIAIVTRPGVESRRGEVDSVESALSPFLPVMRLTAPSCLDGGDVLLSGRTLFVGRSARTNDAGIDSLRAIAAEYDHEVVAVETQGCLHLKTAVTEVAPDTILLNPEWVTAGDLGVGAGVRRALEVDPTEPFASNVLRVGTELIVSAAHPRTRARLEAEGLRCHTVDVSELAKAEAGLTCCSLLLET